MSYALAAFFFLFSLILQGSLIVLAKRLRMGQLIYSLSPPSHQSKRETPSLGGLGILASLGLGVWVFQLWHPNVQWLLGLTMVFGGIGFLDDVISKVRSDNKGLSARQKFLLQVLAGLWGLWTYSLWIGPLTLIHGLFFLFVIVGSSNATNLSDGLDGLLGGLSIITLIGFTVVSMVQGQLATAQLCGLMILSLLAFLAFNIHPAKVFMGDTGSLALGACFGGLAIAMGNPWLLLPLGAVYIIETLSVIIQVGYFKLTKGKRVFLMAPLHHHFELLGLSEPIVVGLFWGMGLMFLALFLLLR